MSQNENFNNALGYDSIPNVEDVVDYRIYVYPPLETDEEYQRRLNEITTFVNDQLVKDYIWQDEPFSLALVEGLDSSSLEPPKPLQTIKSQKTTCHFYGSTRFGDNLEDEWFIVHILVSISKKFPDLAISVVDNDGEFLLIEAAMKLPNWLKPETAVHRVWIRNGLFHLIPLPLVPDLGSTQKAAISNALSTIGRNPDKTIADPEIQNILQQRVSKSAASIEQNSHQWSACILPLKIAYLLKQKPHLIAKAVTSFYHRDPINLRNASKFTKFGTSPKVTTMVRFTRCLYAQIVSQHWAPPKSYGSIPQKKNDVKTNHANSVGQSSNITQSSSTATSSASTGPQLYVPSFAYELGAKIACGFEILYQQEKERSHRFGAAQALHSYQFESDPQWITYKQKLIDMRYFRGLSETSLKFMDLEKRAKEKFLAVNPDKIKSVLPPSICDLMDSILASSEFENLQNPDEMFDEGKLFKSTSTEWMNISPEELDKILLERQMEQEGLQKEEREEQQSQESSDTQRRQNDIFDSITKDMHKFLNMKSSVEGVEFEEPKTKKHPNSTAPQQGEKKDGVEVETDEEDEDSDFYDTEDDDSDVDLDDIDQNLELDENAIKAERLEMLELMRQMDSELLETELSKSFERRPTNKKENDEDDEDDDDMPPLSELDIDENMNLVKNFIESYASQHGVAGPVSTLLGQLDEWKRNSKNQ